MYILIGAAAFIAGIVITAAVVIAAKRAEYARRQREKRRRKTTAPPATVPNPTEPQEENRHKIEFVKIIVFFVLLTYFVGLGFGVYAVKKILLDYPEWAIQALIALFGYIATPTGITIGFYCWKAKAENIIKIKKDNPEETEGIPVDLNNIHT